LKFEINHLHCIARTITITHKQRRVLDMLAVGSELRYERISGGVWCSQSRFTRLYTNTKHQSTATCTNTSTSNILLIKMTTLLQSQDASVTYNR